MVYVTGSKSLHEALKSNKCVTEKRLRLEISGIKEVMERQQMIIHWAKAEEQVADCLTKTGASPIALLKLLQEGLMELNI